MFAFSRPRSWIWVILLALQLVHAAEYGVGFSLAHDHGTASAHFANGTSVDVAKIDGNALYKETMRDPCIMELSSSTHSFECDKHQVGRYSTVQALMHWSSACSYLPDWLCHRPSPALKSMLGALTKAVEKELDTSTPIPAATIVFPFPISDPFRSTIKSTARSLGLNLMIRGRDPAGFYVAYSKQLGTGIDDSFPGKRSPICAGQQFILAVDYSNSSLSTFLIYEACDFLESVRETHCIGPRTAAPTIMSDFSKMKGTHELRLTEEEMAQVFRDITNLPTGDSHTEGGSIKHINHVVLLGERGCDVTMRGVLDKVLREQSMSLALDSADMHRSSSDNAGCEKSGNMTFAAARSMAWVCHNHLEEEEAEAARRGQHGEL